MAPLDSKLSRTEKQQVANKVRNYSTQGRGAERNIVRASRSVGKSMDKRDLTDIDSTVSR